MPNVTVIGAQWGDEGKGRLLIGYQTKLTLL